MSAARSGYLTEPTLPSRRASAGNPRPGRSISSISSPPPVSLGSQTAAVIHGRRFCYFVNQSHGGDPRSTLAVVTTCRRASEALGRNSAESSGISRGSRPLVRSLWMGKWSSRFGPEGDFGRYPTGNTLVIPCHERYGARRGFPIVENRWVLAVPAMLTSHFSLTCISPGILNRWPERPMRVLASIAVTFPFRRAKRGRFSCGVASGAV